MADELQTGIMGWFTGVEGVAIVAAVLISAYQTWRSAQDARERDADRRTERALDLYRDLVVEGDTAAAFHRLSVRLRTEGSAKFGITTWFCPSDEDFDAGAILDPGAAGSHTPFEDLYRVLWFFERVKTSLDGGLVDQEMLFATIGFHCWWWGSLLSKVTGPKATASLAWLAPQAANWAFRHGELENWLTRCDTDFSSGGAIAALRSGDANQD